jgi:hypothetical protein
MEDRLHDVLSGLDAKQGRSRLEPYGEFVDELRCQGFTCGDIAAVLAGGDVSVQNVEKCCQPVGAGASKKAEEGSPPNFA